MKPTVKSPRDVRRRRPHPRKLRGRRVRRRRRNKMRGQDAPSASSRQALATAGGTPALLSVNATFKIESDLWHIKKGRELHETGATRTRSGWGSRHSAGKSGPAGPLSWGGGGR